MLRAYGEKRRCYLIVNKSVKREQALKMAAVELHEKVENLEISCAVAAGESEDEVEFYVELKHGNLWCISRKGNK